MVRLYHKIRLFTRIISTFSELYQHLSVSDAASSQRRFPWRSWSIQRSLCKLCPRFSFPWLALLGHYLPFFLTPFITVFKGPSLHGGCSTHPPLSLRRSCRPSHRWVSALPWPCYRCKNGFSMYSAVLYSSYSPGAVYRRTFWIRRNSAAYVAGD